MSLTTLEVSVRRKLGLGDTDPVVPDAVLVEAINEANQSISTEKDWPWLYKEVSGTTTPASDLLALPADFARAIFLTVKGDDVEPRSSRDLARFRTQPSGMALYGVPTYYAPAGPNFKLSPTPGVNSSYPYVMGYVSTEPLLAAGGDTPLLPVAYQGWLVTRAAMLVTVRTENTERLAALQVEDEAWRKRVIDNVRRSSAISSIRRTKPSIWQSI